eukprot:TRINITY_DN5196_c0_g1_i1.p1 TRINITY_DN5196_c0_g1~~TRINITY_DN5196_c0_g1_i1.p1  ORF type:complete len:517 (-),score=81.94 TRINITY_DN5196_c0_g1_i1:39-1589(-)
MQAWRDALGITISAVTLLICALSCLLAVRRWRDVRIFRQLCPGLVAMFPFAAATIATGVILLAIKARCEYVNAAGLLTAPAMFATTVLLPFRFRILFSLEKEKMLLLQHLATGFDQARLLVIERVHSRRQIAGSLSLISFAFVPAVLLLAIRGLLQETPTSQISQKGAGISRACSDEPIQLLVASYYASGLLSVVYTLNQVRRRVETMESKRKIVRMAIFVTFSCVVWILLRLFTDSGECGYILLALTNAECVDWIIIPALSPESFSPRTGAKQIEIPTRRPAFFTPDTSGSQRSSRSMQPVTVDGSQRGMSPLEALLADPIGFQSFSKFLTQELSLENLIFWRAVRLYKEDKSPLSARQIYDIFIDGSAPLVVNIGAQARGRIVQTLTKFHLLPLFNPSAQLEGNIPDELAEVFDYAAAEVQLLMETDSLRRFFQSERSSPLRVNGLSRVNSRSTMTSASSYMILPGSATPSNPSTPVSQLRPPIPVPSPSSSLRGHAAAEIPTATSTPAGSLRL